MKGKMPFKMHEIINFQKKKELENMCAYPTLNFQTITRNTLIFFYLAYYMFAGHTHVHVCRVAYILLIHSSLSLFQKTKKRDIS